MDLASVWWRRLCVCVFLQEQGRRTSGTMKRATRLRAFFLNASTAVIQSGFASDSRLWRPSCIIARSLWSNCEDCGRKAIAYLRADQSDSSEKLRPRKRLRMSALSADQETTGAQLPPGPKRERVPAVRVENAARSRISERFKRFGSLVADLFRVAVSLGSLSI